MNHPITETSNKIRKSIWDISNVFHCSIIGTCLTLQEARGSLLKAGFSITGDVSDYAIHGTVISHLDRKNTVSKIIQKTLENQYRRDIYEFSKIKKAEDLKEAWGEAFSRGNIPGPYWAVMTHPAATIKLLNEAFGDVHMLSHLNGNSRRETIEKISRLEQENERLAKEKKFFKSHIRELEKSTEELISLRNIIRIREKETADYKKQIEALHNGSTMSKLFEQLFIAANIYEEERHQKEKLQQQLDRLQKDLLKSEELTASLQADNESMRKQLSCENINLNTELALIENDMITLSVERGECEKCENERCLCKELNGKTILYVGGKPSVIPHCRELVEKNGGVFLHHDGGQEENLSVISGIVSRADAIFCPMDCISHNACRRIKKICGRCHKELKLMNNSGVTTFIREMDEVFNHGSRESKTLM